MPHFSLLEWEQHYHELEARYLELEKRFALLEAANQILREKLNTNSSNSSKPPSLKPPTVQNVRNNLPEKNL